MKTRRAVRYLAAAALLHPLWEIAQLPLYALWHEGTAGQIVFAVFHCSLGDLMITVTALALGALIAAFARWPPFGLRMAMATIAFGLAYTVFSEWLNVAVRRNWAYTAAMPTVPPFGTGLAPLLQWLLIPALAWRLATRGVRLT